MAGAAVKRLVCQLGAAGAQDHLGRDLDVEPGLHGRADVDLGEHPEALLSQGSRGSRAYCVVVRDGGVSTRIV